MDNWIIEAKCDLRRNSAPVIQLGTLMLPGDANAHTMRLRIMVGNNPADLTGASAMAYFQLANNGLVEYVCEISGNTVLVTLKESCYKVPGDILCIVRLQKDQQIVSIAEAHGYVRLPITGDPIVPDIPVHNVEEMLEYIHDLENLRNSLDGFNDKWNAFKGDIIRIQPEQPTEPDNVMWVDSDNTQEYQVPSRATHEALKARVKAIEDGGSGLTEAAKNALVACFEHVIWDDANGPARITALKTALGILDVDINIGGGGQPSVPDEIIPGV